jgi:hypothetical protein
VVSYSVLQKVHCSVIPNSAIWFLIMFIWVGKSSAIIILPFSKGCYSWSLSLCNGLVKFEQTFTVYAVLSEGRGAC